MEHCFCTFNDSPLFCRSINPFCSGALGLVTSCLILFFSNNVFTCSLQNSRPPFERIRLIKCPSARKSAKNCKRLLKTSILFLKNRQNNNQLMKHSFCRTDPYEKLHQVFQRVLHRFLETIFYAACRKHSLHKILDFFAHQ